MRLLQLQAATHGQKRVNDGTSEQLEKRVTLNASRKNPHPAHIIHLTCLQFKAMEDGIKKLTKSQQKSEKLQERQASSLELLVKLQTQA